MSRRVRNQLRWVVELEEFVAEHQRLPLLSRGRAEERLLGWMRRVSSGRTASTSEVRERVERAVAVVPGGADRRLLSGGNPETLREANARRSAEVAERNAALAAGALRVGCREKYREVLRVRVEFPAEGLAELAARLGLTKAQYAGRLKRALEEYPAE